MGSQRVGYNWAIELNWTEDENYVYIFYLYTDGSILYTLFWTILFPLNCLLESYPSQCVVKSQSSMERHLDCFQFFDIMTKVYFYLREYICEENICESTTGLTNIKNFNFLWLLSCLPCVCNIFKYFDLCQSDCWMLVSHCTLNLYFLLLMVQCIFSYT